ncbi:MAG TPA: (Fe-S)-binding protein, partial [Pseudomonas sp.]|nr:(Fe-S)-binding protein [Pseudomonas sp.]
MNAQQRIPAIQIENAGAPDFRARARKSLKDDQLRRNFRTAMDSLMTKRAAAFSDADERERLREMGNHIRARALSKLPELL